MNSLTGGSLLTLVLLLNGLLAAAGSALRNSQPAQLSLLEEEGATGARLAARVASQATRLILSVRIGQSLLRLIGVGLALAVAYPILEANGGVAYITLVAVLAAAWVLFGLVNFLAENYTQRDPVPWALRLAPLVALVEFTLSPAIWLSTRLASRASNASDGNRYPMVTEEEIMTLVDAGEEGGSIEGEERAMIRSIFQLGDTLAREVMVPRIDIVAFEAGTTLVEATQSLLESGHSRVPVYSDSIDNIIGLLYSKDLLSTWPQGVEGKTVSELVREAYFVPETKKVDELLTEMQNRHIQMAIVVDEYGGTAGVVTFEDIVEEIVGEVQDEYDVGEEMPYQQVGEDEYVFSGGIDLDDLNILLGAELPKEASETLGGFIYSHLGRVPLPGEVIEAGGLRLTVEQVVGRRIRKVRAHLLQVVPEEAELTTDDNHRAAED